MWRRAQELILALGALLLVGCGSDDQVQLQAADVSVPSIASPASGSAAMDHFECARCHDGRDTTPLAKHCVHCHQAVEDGSFEAPADALADWQKNIHSMRFAPSLVGAGTMLRQEWVAQFLLSPHDVRPHLPAMMPRLALSEKQARDVAAELAARDRQPMAQVALGDVERGRKLYAAMGCADCHRYEGSGAEQLRLKDVRRATAGRALAPDLRHARERLRVDALRMFLMDPVSVKPGSPMPKTPMTEAQALDLAAFVMRAPLGEIAAATLPARLPVLKREVSFDEVGERVFKKVCWHCHSQPDFARGDGGPGNSGGFGFVARQLDLSSYASIASGYLNRDGELTSAYPMLVPALLARQKEQVGQPDPNVRGMPLGLPALSPEEIQLVESWIAQGRPR